MVVRSSSYLGLTLVFALGVGCGDASDPQQNSMAWNPAVGNPDAGFGAVSTDAGLTANDASPVLPVEQPSTPVLPAQEDGGAEDAGSEPVESDAGTDERPNAGGTCCADGDCLCHGDAPSALTSSKGPFATAELKLPLGTVTYPTDAEPPFASVALCGGFTNTGPEMAAWAPFYASHGIVTIITTTGALDDPGTRGTKLLAALEQLKAENTKSGSPLEGRLDVTRVGTSGYSMGGGGTTLASVKTPTLKTSVGLAAWGPATSGVTVPTLLLCGNSDTTAPCNMSQGAYNGIQDPTPKMLVAIDGATHFSWFGPTDAGNGISGQYALAFQKVYLEGDTRWEPLLKSAVARSKQTTNIK